MFILAHIGSFVPARQCRLGPIDKLFTRIGAHDDLVQGRSTFMVEMTEMAYIYARPPTEVWCSLMKSAEEPVLMMAWL